jgi:hypothetical protein
VGRPSSAPGYNNLGKPEGGAAGDSAGANVTNGSYSNGASNDLLNPQ